MTPQKPSLEFEKIALSAAKTIGVDATVVDLVQESSTGNIFVLEVNPILGIFVESAITHFDKSTVREIHPVYANDSIKLTLLSNYLDSLGKCC